MRMYEIMRMLRLPMRISTDDVEYVLLHSPEKQLKRAMDVIFYNGVFVCPNMAYVNTDKPIVFVFNNDTRTLLHELGHAAGYYVNRSIFKHLNEGRQNFTRRELAYEEIVAECVANLLSLEFGLGSKYNDRHEEYVSKQLKQFTYDMHDKVIQYALEDAHIAVEYIMKHWVAGVVSSEYKKIS